MTNRVPYYASGLMMLLGIFVGYAASQAHAHYFGPLESSINWVGFLGFSCAVAAADLVYRLRQKDVRRAALLFTPWLGGRLALLPLWIFGVIGVLLSLRVAFSHG